MIIVLIVIICICVLIIGLLIAGDFTSEGVEEQITFQQHCARLDKLRNQASGVLIKIPRWYEINDTITTLSGLSTVIPEKYFNIIKIDNDKINDPRVTGYSIDPNYVTFEDAFMVFDYIKGKLLERYIGKYTIKEESKMALILESIANPDVSITLQLYLPTKRE